MKKIILSLVIVFSLVSCGFNSNTSNKNAKNAERYVADAVGSPYELFVVTDTSTYRGAIGDSLKVALREEVYMINYSEPSFDLFNIAADAFGGVNTKQRNILAIYIDPKYEKAESYIIRDKTAKPQMVVVLQAPDRQQMMKLVLEERFKIKNAFEVEEIARFKQRANMVKDNKVSNTVDSMFNIKISIPQRYTIRDIKSPDFMWISLEAKETSQGIVIYDYPFEGDALTDTMIVEMRNKFVSKIPGGLPNSYMTTGYEFPSETTTLMINNRKWYETIGFWRVENDFMGGPYVSYSTIDTVRKRVVVIDCYVYSPNPSKKQRNLIRQMSGIVQTARIN